MKTVKLQVAMPGRIAWHGAAHFTWLEGEVALS